MTLSAARYLAAGAIDLIEQPDLLDATQQEFRDRTEGVAWASMIPDGNQPPLYEPPAEFLRATGRRWPPKGMTWPVPQVVAQEQLGATGPNLAPVTWPGSGRAWANFDRHVTDVPGASAAKSGTCRRRPMEGNSCHAP